MAIRGEKNGYIAKFLPGEKLLYSHFSGGKFYYIAIFPGGKMARGKNYYATPALRCQHFLVLTATTDPSIMKGDSTNKIKTIIRPQT